MYSVRVLKIADEKVIILCEGKLTDQKILTNDLKNITENYANGAKELIFDMENVVMINEACYKVFLELKENFSIKLNNCSLFISEQIASL